MLHPADVALVFLFAAFASGGLIWLLRPLWRHYALAKPNARSSHKAPTSQGGGAVVVVVTIVSVALAAAIIPSTHNETLQVWLTLAAAALLAIVGAVDDVKTIDVLPRLLLQMLAVGIVVAALPADLRIVQSLPWWIERTLLLLGGMWFVNLVNFMDGLDWMTVAETVPLTAALAIFGLIGLLPATATVVAVALCGAMIGFAPFNRPVAKLFLGDVGSLPIGLLMAWLLMLLAAKGHLVAAILLPLYYLADTTITLFRRLMNGEDVMQAHRSHFYQRATDNGFTVSEIVAHVFAVNLILVALASATIASGSVATNAAAAATGSVVVVALLLRLSRARGNN